MSEIDGALQVAAGGAPAHAKETFPAKPAPGVIAKINDAVCPAVTVIEVPPAIAGDMVNAGLAFAVNAIVCGESAASSTTVMVAEWRPAARGAILTPIVHVPPAV